MANANANVINYKNTLQEYTMKKSLPLPLYETVNEGFDHLPSFITYVTVNGVRYQSSAGHTRKKETEQSAAKVAVEDMASKVSVYQFEETLAKTLLSELLVKAGMTHVSPKFFTTMTGVAHSPIFTSRVEIDGICHFGGEAKNKREAESNAAFKAFQAMKAQLDETSSQVQHHVESNRNRSSLFKRERMKGPLKVYASWEVGNYRSKLDNTKNLTEKFGENKKQKFISINPSGTSIGN